MFTLGLGFFIIAFLYSTVGYGGGTSYIALLALSGVQFSFIPKLALICNIIVVSGGTYHYLKNGHLNRKLLFPFILSSAPMAFLGGLFQVKDQFYFALLTFSLILCALRILFIKEKAPSDIKTPSKCLSMAVGLSLGFLSGMVGIGGGILLSPLLINMGWARSKEAASLASIFILINSLAGLTGQFTKDHALPELSFFLPLIIAVFIGGQLGSRIGSHPQISQGLIQKTTGILTLLICAKLLLT